MKYLFSEGSFKRGLGYICLLTLLVLLFYREGLRAHFDSLDLFNVRQIVDLAPSWYLYDTWKPVWCGLVHLAYLNFAFNPLPYHVVNLVLYIATLFLLYLFYNLFLENKAISKIAILLFATFYLHAEAVIQFTSNRELLKTILGLSALMYFVHYRKTHCPRYYVLALFFGALTSLSHETSLSLPLLLLAVDYHVLHGVFPPKPQPLKDIRQGLLLHLPFWLMALAVLGYTWIGYTLIGGSIVVNLGVTKTPYDILNQSYFLAIYTFAPCYLTDRFTIILSFIIWGAIGWLFYRSTPQKRSLILTMTALAGFSLIPYTIVGPSPRYFFLSSVFSMFLVTLLAYETGGYIYRLFEERLKGYRLSAERVILTSTMLILLPAIYLNYKDVRQYTRNSRYAGDLVREIVEGTARILPQEPKGTKIFYVNLPVTVKSDAILSQNVFVAHANFHFAALDLYGRRHLIPRMDISGPEDEKVKTIYLDLGYDRVSLDPRAWYDLNIPFVTALSPEEFNTLSKDGKNRILFFNPVTNKLVDVSGWSYEELDRSIAPYRDKLSHAHLLNHPTPLLIQAYE